MCVGQRDGGRETNRRIGYLFRFVCMYIHRVEGKIYIYREREDERVCEGVRDGGRETNRK